MTVHIIDRPKSDAAASDAQKIREAMAALDAEAASGWTKDAWREPIVAAITEEILIGFQHENLLQYMAEVEIAGLTDEILVSEVRGLHVYWIADGGQIDESVISEKVWRLPRDKVGFHITELIEKMESGFSRTSAFLIANGVSEMDAAFSARLLALYQSVIPDNSSPYYIEGAGVSLAALNTALTEVRDESKSDTISIIGRALMVDQIVQNVLNSSWFTQETDESILATGKLGVYFGANIIRLINFRDALNNPRVPGNELFIVGTDAAKVGIFGGIRAEEWNEVGGDYWHYKASRRAGFAIRRPDYIRRIVDTSIPADA